MCGELNNKVHKCYLDANSAPVNNCTICGNRTSICRKVEGPFYECICREGYQMNAAGRCTSELYLSLFAVFGEWDEHKATTEQMAYKCLYGGFATKYACCG